MRFRTLIRRAGAQLLLLGVVGAALVTGAGDAQAATTGVTPSGSVSIHLVRTSSSPAGPNFFLSCVVAPPLVNDNFSNGELSWSGGDQCNAALRMQGTTVLFVWGSSSAFAFGSQYDGVFSAASSSGARFGIFSGLWGVNNNVLFFLPSGWTTNPGGGCFWFDTAHTQVKCTVTTGPVQAQ